MSLSFEGVLTIVSHWWSSSFDSAIWTKREFGRAIKLSSRTASLATWQLGWKPQPMESIHLGAARSIRKMVIGSGAPLNQSWLVKRLSLAIRWPRGHLQVQNDLADRLVQTVVNYILSTELRLFPDCDVIAYCYIILFNSNLFIFYFFECHKPTWSYPQL